MAPVQPAGFLENRQDHTAQTIRLALSGMYAGASVQGATSPAGGVHPTYGGRANVTGTTDMHVSVDTALIYMPSSTAWGGIYAGYNNGAYLVGPLTTASSTQYRSDLICARQHDSQNGDPDDNWDVIFVTGTFSATQPAPVPSLPNNAIPLAVVNVTPNMVATNGAGTITDIRQYTSLPGPIYTTSANKPSVNAPEGTMWFENDTNQLGIIINSARSYVVITTSGTGLSVNAIKTGTTSRTGTTLTNDPDLSLSLLANVTYKFEATLFYDGGSGSNEGDLNAAFALPAGAILNYDVSRVRISDGTYHGGFPTSGNGSFTAQTQGQGSPLDVVLNGTYIGGSAAGALTLKWAQNTNQTGSGASTRLLAGSYLSANRMF